MATPKVNQLLSPVTVPSDMQSVGMQRAGKRYGQQSPDSQIKAHNTVTIS